MCVVKHLAISFNSVVIYSFFYALTVFSRDVQAQLSLTTHLLVCGILIMKQSLISFYHRHDAFIPAATKHPLGTISHLFLSRIPACICPHFYSHRHKVWEVCSVLHLAPRYTHQRTTSTSYSLHQHSFRHVVTSKPRRLPLTCYQAATSGSPGSLN